MKWRITSKKGGNNQAVFMQICTVYANELQSMDKNQQDEMQLNRSI